MSFGDIIDEAKSFALECAQIKEANFKSLGIDNYSESSLDFLAECEKCLRSGSSGRSLIMWSLREIFVKHQIDTERFWKKYLELGIPHETAEKIVEILNDTIVFELGYEFTSHGIKKSFRFLSFEQQRQVAKEASEICRKVSLCLPRIYLAYGALLGLVREGRFIKHDDDLDFVVVVDATTFRAALDIICATLNSAGLIVVGRFHSHVKVQIENTSVDVFAALKEDNYIASFPGPRRSIRLEDVFPTLPGRYLNSVFPLPARPLVYLEKVYGADWQTPQPYWSHDWGLSEFSDLF